MILQQLQEKGQFNIFAGAGISKLPPAYAPIWREMLIDFSGALFTCMKRENWPAVAGNENELEELRKFNFRPETFWQRILNTTSLSFTCEALKVVNLGKPNLNHRIIAELIRKNIVNNVITTNFDEYLELEMQNTSKVIVNSADSSQMGDKSVLFKIHGTISDPKSMQFALEHTQALPEWKTKLLNDCLASRPLLIIGYSGYDDDIFPVLRQLVEKLPEVVVVRYPGASREEPIQRLGDLHNVKIFEANISSELRDWADKEIRDGHLKPNILLEEVGSVPDLEKHYLKALSKLELPRVPYMLSTLLELAANKPLALKYAYLADDAREDTRYEKYLLNELQYDILMNLSLIIAGSGDERMSKYFFEKASKFKQNENAPISSSVFDNVNRVFEYFQQQELTNQQVQEIEMYAGGALNMLQLGVINGDGIKFRALWCMARLRNRQKQHGEAINYYQMVKAIPDEFDDVQKGCFFLDYGSALLQYSLIDKDGETLTSALKAFSVSETFAVRISDHMTAAKAMMNLAQVYYYCGEMDNAISKAVEAERTSKQTGDIGLWSRAHSLVEQLTSSKPRK